MTHGSGDAKPNAQYNVAAPDSLAIRVTAKMRREMYDRFVAVARPAAHETILDVGVTSDLVRRVWEHREGVGSSFARRYGLTRLVYFEHHEDIRTAIQRETSLKRWPRTWKVRLLAAGNPDWEDLYMSLLS